MNISRRNKVKAGVIIIIALICFIGVIEQFIGEGGDLFHLNQAGFKVVLGILLLTFTILFSSANLNNITKITNNLSQDHQNVMMLINQLSIDHDIMKIRTDRLIEVNENIGHNIKEMDENIGSNIKEMNENIGNNCRAINLTTN